MVWMLTPGKTFLLSSCSERCLSLISDRCRHKKFINDYVISYGPERVKNYLAANQTTMKVWTDSASPQPTCGEP